MAVPAAPPLRRTAGTSIAIPPGVRGGPAPPHRQRRHPVAPFCISAPRHEPRHGLDSARATTRRGWMAGATEDGAGHRGGCRRPGRSCWPARRADLRTGAEARRRAPARGEPRPPEAAKGPNTGRLSISAGVDWTSAYFFRGIKQETEDLILQPYGELGVKLVDQAGALTALTVTGGFWNSLHTGPTGLGQRDRVGSEGLVRVRRLRPPLRRPLGGPHDVRPLHRLREPQRRSSARSRSSPSASATTTPSSSAPSR